MKINLANKIGKDKLPLQERVEYVDTVIDEVHAVAEDPRNNLFWMNSDNPWQTLGSIFELSAALKSDNPEEYISHVPVHVDGTCNGMQHYAALGRDENGAV